MDIVRVYLSDCVGKYFVKTNYYDNNKINYIPTQSNTTMYFLTYWLLVSAITAIIRPVFYKNFKMVGYI